MKKLTRAILKKLLHYDKESGVFTWLVDNGLSKVGCVAGKNWDGFNTPIYIRGKSYPHHYLAFLYMTGNFSKYKVCRINKINTDNRWCNLYEVNVEQVEIPFGVKGVTLNRYCWKAEIIIKGIVIYFGHFIHRGDANKAIKSAKHWIKFI